VLRQLLYGLAMVTIMLYRPAGLWPSPNIEDRPTAATEAENNAEETLAAR
jgi:branched-chain amino acid transport system permease protein